MLARSLWLVSATVVSVAAVQGYKSWHSKIEAERPTVSAKAESMQQQVPDRPLAESARLTPDRELTIDEYKEIERGRVAANAGDLTTALRILGPFARRGYADAQFAIGSIYSAGVMLPRSDADAFKWWALAARQGQSYARYFLCRASLGGNGLAQQLNREAADAYALSRTGHPASMHPSTHSLEEFVAENKDLTMREALVLMSMQPNRALETPEASCRRFAVMYP